MVTEMQRDYLTIEEAAVRAHASSSTIRRAIRSGALRYRATHGKTKLLQASDVDTWAEHRTAFHKIVEESAG